MAFAVAHFPLQYRLAVEQGRIGRDLQLPVLGDFCRPGEVQRMRTGDDAEFVRMHDLHAAVGGQPNIVEHEAAHGRCSVIAIGQ